MSRISFSNSLGSIYVHLIFGISFVSDLLLASMEFRAVDTTFPEQSMARHLRTEFGFTGTSRPRTALRCSGVSGSSLNCYVTGYTYIHNCTISRAERPSHNNNYQLTHAGGVGLNRPA